MDRLEILPRPEFLGLIALIAGPSLALAALLMTALLLSLTLIRRKYNVSTEDPK